MRRIGSAALAAALPLLGMVPAIGLAQDAQPVSQPTPPPGYAPPAAVVPPPAPAMAAPAGQPPAA